MPNPPRDLNAMFPCLASLFGSEKFQRSVDQVEAWHKADPRRIARPLKGHSRGFWNTCLLARAASSDLATAALWRLWIIEQGLIEASRAGKHLKFRSTLAADEAGFDQGIAELFAIGALCKGVPVVDFERPGSKPGKNYDIHLEPAGEAELHIDVKWRTETPVGEASAEVLANWDDLLAGQVSRQVFVSLKCNRLSDGDQLRAACAIADGLSAVEANNVGPHVTDANLPSLPPSLRSWALDLRFRQEVCHTTNIGGIDALFVPSESAFLLDDKVIESFEVGPAGHTIVVIPRSETRAVFSKDYRAALAGRIAQGKPFDHENPESAGIADLLRSVHLQLPSTPTNVVALGLFDYWAFEDASYALEGEPDLAGSRSGGLFDAPFFAAISAVVAFALTPPSSEGDIFPVATRTFVNPNATHTATEAGVDRIRGVLEAHAAEAKKQVLALR